jgi:hypothetical protein
VPALPSTSKRARLEAMRAVGSIREALLQAIDDEGATFERWSQLAQQPDLFDRPAGESMAMTPAQ